jgi:glycosyltransferase involved in cell wall biosynthesis
MLRIAILLHKLRGGGVQRSLLHLAKAFQARGHAVSVLVLHDAGPGTHDLPEGVTPVYLPATNTLRARRAVLRADPEARDVLLRPVLAPLIAPWPIKHLESLAGYLERNAPDILYTAGPYQNLIGLWARDLSGAPTRVVGSERIGFPHFQTPIKRTQWRWRYLDRLVRHSYPRFDAMVAVSKGVAEELCRATGLPAACVTPIYNPVVSPRIAERAAEAATHPWFQAARDVPVILGVGRLAALKDFATLIRAFAKLRAARPARLVILGEGPHRRRLLRLARRLQVHDDIDLPGWAANPYAYYARADLFVLSSRGEGLPNALLEAMACGCPVVSTDCHSGPREILDSGRIAPLVPVGDVDALAGAMAKTLEAPPTREAMTARACDFSMDRSAETHLALFERLRQGQEAALPRGLEGEAELAAADDEGAGVTKLSSTSA